MYLNQHKSWQTIGQLIRYGLQQMLSIFASMLEIAMPVEQEILLGAETDQRTPHRRADRNGPQPKRLDLPGGTVIVPVLRTAGHAPRQSLYPQALERGRRYVAALGQLAAEMYVHGVSTRHVLQLLQNCGLQFFSTAQVSRATQQLDAVLEE